MGAFVRIIILAFVATLAACGPQTSEAPSSETPSAQATSSSLADQLSDLGFYASQTGRLTKVDFRDYHSAGTNSGATNRELPKADFPNVPVLGADDALILFGELTGGPFDTGVTVFLFTENGSTWRSMGGGVSVETFFSRTPLDPVRGNAVTKFQPTAAAENGLYSLHRYVGMNGDAHLVFRVQR